MTDAVGDFLRHRGIPGTILGKPSLKKTAPAISPVKEVPSLPKGKTSANKILATTGTKVTHAHAATHNKVGKDKAVAILNKSKTTS